MSRFVFDSKTGTMVADAGKPELDMEGVVASAADKPEGKSIIDQPQVPNVDTENEDEVVFKKFSDLSIIRVDDKSTGKWLCYFSGYALDIQFNIEELKGANATKKIEACLEGIQKLFRKIIFDQVIGE